MNSEKSVKEFKKFKESIKERFDGFGLVRDGYDDAVLHIKIDFLLYLLMRKGIISVEELVGKSGDNLNDPKAMKGGFIEQFIQSEKEYDQSKR